MVARYNETMTVGKKAFRKKTASGISTPAQNGD
jgi:hypothetical protein